jgi:multiple sugar transport system ATP-binding protein
MGIELSLSGVTKNFGSVKAVDNMSFTVRKGELFALLGPSGAGKTTTLNMIAGLEKPDRGEILVEGQSIADVRPQFRDFAMVFESYALYPHLTVAENIAFPLRAPLRREALSTTELWRRVSETARMLEIEELLERYPKELSGGQKQRVGLGRALVRDSQLFLLDEPIAHLDAKLRHRMRGELKRLQKKSGRTTVLATPDYAEVVAMADRAAVIDRGVIQQIGTPVELFNHPINIVVARAIGDPPINLLRCNFHQENGSPHLAVEGIPLELDPQLKEAIATNATPSDLMLGIRPGEVTIHRDPSQGLLAAEVYVFEPLGGEAVATLVMKDTRMKVLCAWEDKLAIGSKVGISFAPNKIHFFDKVTGMALYGRA